MKDQNEKLAFITRSLQDFRQEFFMGEYVEYTGKMMAALCGVTTVALRGWIAGIRLDLWGRNTYKVHWEDMPDAAFASEEIDPDLLKPMVTDEVDGG